MNTHDLIEFAVLDAMGLLEDNEQQAFEQAFAAAPEPIRTQARAEQDRVLDMRHLLPDAEPSDALRDLVLSAVRRAMDAEQEPVAARIGACIGAVTAAAGRSHAPAQPRLKMSRRVSPVWRAAAIGLTAAVIAMGTFVFQITRIDAGARHSELIASLYDSLGPDVVHDMLFDPQTEQIYFGSTSEAHITAVAAVVRNPDWEAAHLFIQNLKASAPGERFRLVVLDDQGRIVKELQSFESDGQLLDVEVDVDPADQANLAIMGRDNSKPLLTGNL